MGDRGLVRRRVVSGARPGAAAAPAADALAGRAQARALGAQQRELARPDLQTRATARIRARRANL